jgi:hypothetical protein
MKDNPSTAISSRRAWIRGGTGLAVLLAQPRLLAQGSRFGDVLQSMSSLTGTELDNQWVEPTATLVSVILEDSKSLRSLDLGAIEPAITFSAR